MARPFGVLPKAAIRFLRGKGLKTSRHWTDVWREEHAVAFTAARMTRLSLVQETHRELVKALEAGETMETFRARLQPFLERRGWARDIAEAPRGGDIPTRLDRIYRANMRSSRAAGQWDRVQRTKQLMPFLVYELGPSRDHRPEHEAWAGTCLPVDHPWWRTVMPPNGWGCKCRVRQITRAERDRLVKAGKVTTEAPALPTRQWTNPATGEVHEVPVGIDPGWDTNPGYERAKGVGQAGLDRLDSVLGDMGEAAGGRWGRRYTRELMSGAPFKRFARRPQKGEVMPIGVLPARPEGTRSRLLTLQGSAVRKPRGGRKLRADDWLKAQRIMDAAAAPVPAGRPGRWRWDATVDGTRWRLVTETRDGRATVVTMHERT